MSAMNWNHANDPKLAALMQLLRDMESAVVAFSGGTDSSFLAAVAHRSLGPRALAVTGVSPTYPRRDRDDAARLARQHGWAHRFIETREVDNPVFADNPPDRCYHCKSELFGLLRGIADSEGFRWVIDGSNADDVNDYRPGGQAGREWGVRSPLQEAGFAKADVRASARRIGLDIADKPASACLSSRFPYGTRITTETLKAVELAEEALRGLGFVQVRVRAHGEVARIEVAPEELERISDPALRRQMAADVKARGFRYVALDLEGYRMGSLNESLQRG